MTCGGTGIETIEACGSEILELDDFTCSLASRASFIIADLCWNLDWDYQLQVLSLPSTNTTLSVHGSRYHTTSLLLINIIVQRAQNFIYRSNLFWNRMNSSEIWPSLSPWSDQRPSSRRLGALQHRRVWPPFAPGNPSVWPRVSCPNVTRIHKKKSLFKQVPSDFRDTQRGRSPKSDTCPFYKLNY